MTATTAMHDANDTPDALTVRTDLRRTLNKLLQQRTGRRPMVVPVIMEI